MSPVPWVAGPVAGACAVVRAASAATPAAILPNRIHRRDRDAIRMCDLLDVYAVRRRLSPSGRNGTRDIRGTPVDVISRQGRGRSRTALPGDVRISERLARVAKLADVIGVVHDQEGDLIAQR